MPPVADVDAASQPPARRQVVDGGVMPSQTLWSDATSRRWRQRKPTVPHPKRPATARRGPAAPRASLSERDLEGIAAGFTWGPRKPRLDKKQAAAASSHGAATSSDKEAAGSPVAVAGGAAAAGAGDSAAAGAATDAGIGAAQGPQAFEDSEAGDIILDPELRRQHWSSLLKAHARHSTCDLECDVHLNHVLNALINEPGTGPQGRTPRRVSSLAALWAVCGCGSCLC